MKSLGLLIGVFAELHQRAAGALGVEERDIQAFSTLAGSLVDELATLFRSLGQGIGHSVGHGESDMLDAAAATVLFDKLADCALGGGTFEKLDLGLAYLKKGGAHFLVGNFFDCEALETEYIFIERNSLFQIRHCDTYVFNVRNIHNNVIMSSLFMIFRSGDTLPRYGSAKVAKNLELSPDAYRNFLHPTVMILFISNCLHNKWRVECMGGLVRAPRRGLCRLPKKQ